MPVSAEGVSAPCGDGLALAREGEGVAVLVDDALSDPLGACVHDGRHAVGTVLDTDSGAHILHRSDEDADADLAVRRGGVERFGEVAVAVLVRDGLASVLAVSVFGLLHEADDRLTDLSTGEGGRLLGAEAGRVCARHVHRVGELGPATRKEGAHLLCKGVRLLIHAWVRVHVFHVLLLLW